MDYAPVKGFMVIKPYGYALWETCKGLDDKLRATGHSNAYFPLFIPGVFFKKRRSMWRVCTGGGLGYRRRKRQLHREDSGKPTSEAIVCSMYSKWIRSYRVPAYTVQPMVQRCQMGKSTRPFLRTSSSCGRRAIPPTHRRRRRKKRPLGWTFTRTLRKTRWHSGVDRSEVTERKICRSPGTYTMEALMLDGKALRRARPIILDSILPRFRHTVP